MVGSETESGCKAGNARKSAKRCGHGKLHTLASEFRLVDAVDAAPCARRAWKGREVEPGSGQTAYDSQSPACALMARLHQRTRRVRPEVQGVRRSIERASRRGRTAIVTDAGIAHAALRGAPLLGGRRSFSDRHRQHFVG